MFADPPRRGRNRGRWRTALAAVLLAWLASLPAVARPVALELVLAIDASASVQRGEFDLQAQGLARAFRHERVLSAIDALGERRIAVTIVQWSGPARQRVAVPWTLIGDRAKARAFARDIDHMPRFVTSGGTAIGQATAFAQQELAGNGHDGARRVIDVSGDGRANMGRAPERARDTAVAAGITINGLAILNEEAGVDRYYADHVIGGPGAFLMTAQTYETFARAIRRKLVREITGAGVASAPAPAGRRTARGDAPLAGFD